MRKIKCIVFAIVIASLTSCGGGGNDEDSIDVNEGLAAEQNATESNKIDVATLETAVSIEGASKSNGTPPAPNSNLDLQLNTDLNEGFQETGLSIQFSSNANVSGAYILFKSIDGVPSSNYFDIPSTSFKQNTKSKKNKETKNIFSQ